MNPDPFEASMPLYCSPGLPQIRSWTATFRAGKHEFAFLLALLEEFEGKSTQYNRFAASLAVGQKQQTAFEVDIAPFEIENLTQTRACEKEQSESKRHFWCEDGSLALITDDMLALLRLTGRIPGQPDCLGKAEEAYPVDSGWSTCCV